MVRRVGVFGLSANPPHEGHVEMARIVYKRLKLDEVWMLVTPQNWQKSRVGMASLEDRMEMCRLLTLNEPWLVPKDIEKDLIPNDQDYIPTIDTLTHLRRMFPDHRFAWIMGADNLVKFHTWERWQEIIQTTPLVILDRPGESAHAMDSTAANYARAYFQDAAENMDLEGPQWCFLNDLRLDISSTKIRDLLKAGEKPPGVVDPVLRFIAMRGLYRR